MPRKMTKTTKRNNGQSGITMLCINIVIAAKVNILPIVATGHAKCSASHAYTRQNATREKPPLYVPSTEEIKKAVSWLRERKKITGPEVSGSPINQPLTADPHLRPAKLAEPIIIGARISFNTRKFIFITSNI